MWAASSAQVEKSESNLGEATLAWPGLARSLPQAFAILQISQ